MIERVEDLFLRLVLTRDELDVIDKPCGDISLLASELIYAVVLKSGNELFCKLLRLTLRLLP